VDIFVGTLGDELNDDGDCSLREAIITANTSAPTDNCMAGSSEMERITFSVSGAILPSAQLPHILPACLPVIDGGQATTVKGKFLVRVFREESAAHLHLILKNLTVAQGHVQPPVFGVGVHNSGTLTIADSSFSDNSSQLGAGIYSDAGTVTTTGSTLSGKILDGYGRSIDNHDHSTLSVTDSTFSRNSTFYGGGIYRLVKDSPAIDSGSCPGVTADQRRFPRPVDVLGIPNFADGCDIGAFEFQVRKVFLPFVFRP
jgi:CSLREA domain-containing protein